MGRCYRSGSHRVTCFLIIPGKFAILEATLTIPDKIPIVCAAVPGTVCLDDHQEGATALGITISQHASSVGSLALE